MAFMIEVSISLRDTEPEVAGNPGYVIRGERGSSIVMAADGSSADAMILAAAKAESLCDEILTDVKGQMEVWARNFGGES